MTRLLAALVLVAVTAGAGVILLGSADPVPVTSIESTLVAETTAPTDPVASTQPDRSAGGSGWVPDPGVTWAWYLQGGEVPRRPVEVYDVDVHLTSAADVEALHREGARVVCYFSAGTWEDYRPDADLYPAEVLGDYWGEWGEHFLDIRRLDVLGPILEARMDTCVEKGFDAVEPDMMDTYQTDTGFPLTEEDQVVFNTWLAEQAHARGLSVAQKNISDLAGVLVDHFDFVIAEDCFADGWCVELAPYLEQGKAVLAAEYTDRVDSIEPFCGTEGFSIILTDRDLTGVWSGCG
jgi:hypothetical protein